jgi:hypothetical protein
MSKYTQLNTTNRYITSGVHRIFSGREGFQEFFSARGFKQIQLRAEGRENGDLGALAP